MGSSVVAFMVAGVLFMASVVAVLVATNNTGSKGTTDESSAAAMRIQARDLAGTVLTSPGFGASGVDWAEGANYNGHTLNAEHLDRLGLLDDQSVQPNMLEYAKFQNLRRAKYAADPTDGYVDYREAVHSLGLDAAGLDFHVRAYPALQSVVDLLREGARDRNLRVAYVGDIDVQQTYATTPPPSPTWGLGVSRPTCAASPVASNLYRIQSRVYNNGTVDTAFNGLFTYNLAGTGAESQNTNTYLVPAGQSRPLYVDVPAASVKVGSGTVLRSCTAASTASVDVLDPLSNKVETGTVAFGAATGPAGFVTAPRDLWLDTSKPSYVNSGASCDPVVVNYDGVDVAKNDRLALRVFNNDTGAQVLPAAGYYVTGTGAHATNDGGFYIFTAPNPDQKKTVTVGCLPPGPYRAILTYYTGGHPSESDLKVSERVLVTASALPAYAPAGTSTPTGTVYVGSGPAGIEAAYLDTLVDQFCPSVFDSKSASPLLGWTAANWDARCAFKGAQAQPGDVFPDSKKVMNDDLPARLLNPDGTPNYAITNVLVIGSGVDQNSMTSQSAKGTIRDWVVGGGSLIVFGSTEGNVNWLEPLFHSAIRSGGGGISTPDIGHPILHTPDELDDPAHNYDARGEVWRFNGQTAQVQQNESTALFTNVIVEGDAQTGNPLLADSKPGAIGNGSIILTSYLPYDLYDDAAKSSQTSSGPDACPGRTTGACEAMKFIHNLLMSGYGDLYLDYGPECPQETNCIPEVRSAQIRHPDFTDPIQLQLNVFVFPH
jgi:hypothetical protein